MAEEERYIYFIAHPTHLIKTARDCLSNSLASRCIVHAWNNNNFITWNHISKLFYDDLESMLHIVPKLTNDHISLTSYPVMNVRLAAHVLSESVYTALQTYGTPDTTGTATYCIMFDKFFDCLNIKDPKNKKGKKDSQNCTGKRQK